MNLRLKIVKNNLDDYVTAVALLVIFTIYDILMWHYTIKPFYIALQWNNYHLFSFEYLIPAVLILMGISVRSYVIPLYTYVMIMNGMEDILYYVFQGRNPVAYLQWSYQSLSLVVFKIAGSLLIIIFMDLMVRHWHRTLQNRLTEHKKIKEVLNE